jgi:CDP-diacylglycerol---glycerol-3-phosphate 3-phosphatidyltransferase
VTIANWLTFVRLCISPIFLFIYLGYEMLHISPEAVPYVLLILLAISEASDFSDGYFARKYNQVTELGKILDPMADSITRISVFLAFTQPPIQLPVVFVFFFLYRDSVVSTLRTICALRGFTLSARQSGKIKAVLQGASAIIILMLMIPYNRGEMTLEALQWYSQLIVGFACVYTIYSGMEYIFANGHFIAKLSSLGSGQE